MAFWEDVSFDGLPGEEGFQIRIRELPMADGVHASTGCQLWPSSIVLAKELLRRPHLVAGKKVLEVGAGCGLLGITAGRLARSILITDGDEEVVRNLEFNIETNKHVWLSKCPDMPREVSARQLRWEDVLESPWTEDQRAEVIIASDIIYGNWGDVVAKAFLNLLAPGGLVLMAASEDRRSGVRVFQEHLEMKSFRVLETKLSEPLGDFRIYECRGPSLEQVEGISESPLPQPSLLAAEDPENNNSNNNNKCNGNNHNNNSSDNNTNNTNNNKSPEGPAEQPVSKQLWRVVGGHAKGGIIVREGPLGALSACLKERLALRGFDSENLRERLGSEFCSNVVACVADSRGIYVKACSLIYLLFPGKRCQWPALLQRDLRLGRAFRTRSSALSERSFVQRLEAFRAVSMGTWIWFSLLVHGKIAMEIRRRQSVASRIHDIKKGQGFGCACSRKTELKLLEWLQLCVGHSCNVEREVCGCVNSATGRHLPFDFRVKERILIELDGWLHFCGTDFLGNPCHATPQRDLMKERWALENDHVLIRVLQKDVWSELGGWQSYLLNSIAEAESDSRPRVIVPDAPEYQGGIYHELRAAVEVETRLVQLRPPIPSHFRRHDAANLRTHRSSEKVGGEYDWGQVLGYHMGLWGAGFGTTGPGAQDGSVVTWGDAGCGGDSSAVAPLLTEGVIQVCGNVLAFAAIKDDGSVVTWGNAGCGGDSSAVAPLLTGGVVQVCGNANAFAAIKEDGSVVTWGDAGWGGDSSPIAPLLTEGVVQVCGNANAFAAIKDDGSVVTWGNADRGGDSSAVAPLLTEGVVQVCGNAHAFTAIKEDGSVVTWGDASCGGDSSAVASLLTEGVIQVCGNANAFAAIKADGSVVTWGDADCGGDSSAVAPLLTGVFQVCGNIRAFAAIKDDGSVVTWGNARSGGDSSAIAPLLMGGVVQVYGSIRAFTAIKADGSVVTWGDAVCGGDSSAVAPLLTEGVAQICGNILAFAAIKDDGSVVTWGNARSGGDSSAVAPLLTEGVVQVCGSANAFTAIKEDGSVVTWGNASFGGDSSAVAPLLTEGVVQVC
ncbi:unnamed protein product [Polarella glacialis]|uniref:Calmodulin-lysine N-methyltransferase n=1 Tax=Polarella glacialis TaxID=89957 RepID=A0A813LUN1_POLGL|nr:unnamed protein product [Polarella glacialis]